MNTHSPSRSGFGTLMLVGIIVTVLLVTGIGQYIWRQGGQLGAHCRDLVMSVGWQGGLDSCQKVGQYVVSFQRKLELKVGRSKVGDAMNLEEFAGHLARQFSNATVGYRAPSLSGLINTNALNGGSFNMGGAPSMDRLSMALTQGFQGQSMLNGGQSVQGLNFLKSSASMGDVGVLSQLQLGSAYANGTGGVPQNLGLSRQYYGQALGSINSLESSGSPSSQRLLQALPGGSGNLKMQLQQIVGQ